MRFLISNNPERLAEAIGKYNNSATVEAEYGSICVKGSIATLAHHGERAGLPAPCLAEDFPPSKRPEVVGLSHLDLDALGGCMALMCRKGKDHESFWRLAAFVDVNGPHRLSESGASELDKARLYAFWAYSHDNRAIPSRDGSVQDITDKVMDYMNTLDLILRDDPTLINEGWAFRREEEELEVNSFIAQNNGRVLIRRADRFVNHLYTHEGKVFSAVVALNTKTRAITVSFADSIGVSACEIVQSIWGSKAGGHVGIAGSPRGEEKDEDDLFFCAEEVARKLN